MSRHFIANVRFQVPEPPPALVARPRLVDVLSASSAPMTLVVGTPGAGKTAVLTEWLGRRTGPTAWLSCDPVDVDPVRFWRALALAIQGVVPGAGADALKRIEDDGDVSADMAASLASDCEFAPDLLIVVDDFHHASPAAAVFSAFVRSLPAGVRLVLASRHDPSFPVGRLRVQGRLLELRDENLRFTVGEADTLFANLGIEITGDDLERLCDLTEGWAAGLQLAALSLGSRPDIGGLVEAFAASDRGVADLLLNEVVDIQPDDVADFLMATSVLETFDGDICDAVTGRDDSSDLLRRLHENHLFVIALDRRAGWYRYHHLFAAFLQARLRAMSPQRYRDAHAAASRALAASGDPLAAVEHAMAADDVAGALDLVRKLIATTDDVEDRQIAIETSRAWLRRYGEHYLDDEPNVVLECCLLLIAVATFDGVEDWLRRVEQRAAMLTKSDAAFVTVLWGFLALQRGDPETALDLVRSGQAALGGERSDHFWLAQAPIVLCHAALLLDDAAGVVDEVERAHRAALMAPFVHAVRLPGYQSLAAVVRGDLTDGERAAAQALAAARSMDLDERNVALVVPQLSMAAIARERDELVAASTQLDVVLDRAEAASRPPFIFMAALEHARLAMALGDRDDALATLDGARSIMPDATRRVTDQIDRLAARLAVLSGDHRAGDLVEGLLPTIDRDFLRARLALAGGDPHAAQQLIEATAEAAVHRRQRIERELLLARALARRDREGALRRVDVGLRLAEPVGLVRIVLEEGPEMHALLEALPTDARMGRFVTRVLDAAHRRPMFARRPTSQALVEPLSERELDVVRYLASRLTYHEIAGHLYVSVNTLKSHVKAVYRKLGASSRAEAVELARRAGLL